MQEDPVLENDAEGIGIPIQVTCFLSHIEPGPRSLDWAPSLIEHRIKSLKINGNLALVVEVCELLQADCILVFNPRFYGRTAVVVPGVGWIHISVLKRQYAPATALLPMLRSGT